MSDLDDLTAKLKQARDELKLQLHLGSKEAEEEWEALVSDWDKFVQKTQLDKSAEEVGEAARDLGLKIKAAFDRMRKS
ncbi:hypothetical protein [Pseudodonghicola flavimaris]|uniref:CsbD family protein n=1 Tax=Pseudodonghicola flavimaris TaxID=3050036 RepID=A0ABT7F160_9RHOB|nr:hypothetical protein [Pseudodonghicola flavimaris]MDK3018315.1 hypothetical protein [Pseudodonghicola flavimaris]